MMPPHADDASFAAYLDGIVRAKPIHMRSSTAAIALDLVAVAARVRSRTSLAEEVSRLYGGACAYTLADGLREAMHLWGLYDTWRKLEGCEAKAELPEGVTRLAVPSTRTAATRAA